MAQRDQLRKAYGEVVAAAALTRDAALRAELHDIADDLAAVIESRSLGSVEDVAVGSVWLRVRNVRRRLQAPADTTRAGRLAKVEEARRRVLAQRVQAARERVQAEKAETRKVWSRVWRNGIPRWEVVEVPVLKPEPRWTGVKVPPNWVRTD